MKSYSLPVSDLGHRFDNTYSSTLNSMVSQVQSLSPERQRWAKHLNRIGVAFQYVYYAELVAQTVTDKRSSILDWGG